MRIILVVERKHLFPGLSPQGFLPPDSLDLSRIGEYLFFAERDYMEQNSHYKQPIPYLMLKRGEGAEARVLCYQRKVKHSEQRLGGLWSTGFGGHIEPLDRDDPDNLDEATDDLVRTTAFRELEEETGLSLDRSAFTLVGYINSDKEDVSSVHFGVAFTVDLNEMPDSDAELMELVSRQAEPHQARWIAVNELREMTGPGNGPDGGTFEDWSRIVIEGLFPLT